MNLSPGARHTRRQLAALAALAVAAVATVATSPLVPHVDTTSPTATIRVDSGHALATQLFVVRIPAEAAEGLSAVSVSFDVDSVKATDSAGKPVVPDEAVRIRVLAVSAEAEAGLTPDAGLGLQTPAPAQWTVGGTGQTTLPVRCIAPGPCERAFRVMVTITSQASEAQVTWHLETRLDWYGTAYPTGVGPDVRIDQPVLVAGPAPAVDIATTPEKVTLAADHPVVARVVQMRFRAPSGGSGSVPAGTVEAVTTADDPTARIATRAVTSVYAIPDPPDASASQPPVPATSARLLGVGDDPFSGCVPGSECVRSFLVTMSWAYGDDRAYQWQLVIHRSDLENVLAEPAGTLTLQTLGGIEPLAGPPSRLHFEGDTTYAASEGQQADIPLRVRLVAGSAPAESGPGNQLSAASFARLLPIPGSLHYTITVVGKPPAHTDLYVNVRARVPGVSTEQGVTGVSGSGTGAGNPFIACKADADCPTLTFEGSITYPSALQSERIAVHWSLDVDVYSYPGLQYVLEKGPEPTSSPSSATQS